MSKRTLDEAIERCLEVVKKSEKLKESKYVSDIDVLYCDKNAENHRQLAEWLTELKELRSIIDACNILAVDAFAVEKLCKELKEAKRLLKMALSDLNNGTCSTSFCATCTKVNTEECRDYKNKKYEWIHTAEALKLIGKGEC